MSPPSFEYLQEMGTCQGILTYWTSLETSFPSPQHFWRTNEQVFQLVRKMEEDEKCLAHQTQRINPPRVESVLDAPYVADLRTAMLNNSTKRADLSQLWKKLLNGSNQEQGILLLTKMLLAVMTSTFSCQNPQHVTQETKTRRSLVERMLQDQGSELQHRVGLFVVCCLLF